MYASAVRKKTLPGGLEIQIEDVENMRHFSGIRQPGGAGGDVKRLPFVHVQARVPSCAPPAGKKEKERGRKGGTDGEGRGARIGGGGVPVASCLASLTQADKKCKYNIFAEQSDLSVFQPGTTRLMGANVFGSVAARTCH